MVYNLRPLRLSIISIFLIVILWNLLTSYFGVSVPLFLVVLLIAVGLASFRFKIRINDDHLVYEVFFFFKFNIMKKVISPSEINHMKFIRVSWAKKATILKLKNGFNIRLAVIETNKAINHLIDFANKHDITIIKTNDYLILEAYCKE